MVSSHMCLDQSVFCMLRCDLLRFLFSLFGTLSSLVLCPENSRHLGLPGSSALSLQLKKSVRLWVSPLCAVSWKLHKVTRWSIVGLICSLAVDNHRSLLSEAKCLKFHCVLYFVWFSVVLGERVNLDPVTTSRQGEDIQVFCIDF